MIKVLQVLGAWGSGGIENNIASYCINMSDNIKIDVFAFEKYNNVFDKDIENQNGNIYIKIHSKTIYKIVNQFNELKNHISHNEYDIIHINISSGIGLIYALAARIGNKNAKIIVHCHGDNIAGNNKRIKLFAHKFFKMLLMHIPQYYLSCSKSSAKWLFNKSIIKKNKFKVIPCSVNIDEYLYNSEIRKDIRKDLNIKNDYVIGTIGRIEIQKNPLFIVKIFEEILKINKNCKLLWIGEGSLQEEVENYSKELNVYDNIIFYGTSNKVSNMLSAMDVFILPSLYEGLGIVNIEAQISELYCVVSDVIPEEAKITNKLEYVSLKCSAKEWANKILEFNNGYDRNNISKETKKYDFDSLVVAKKLEKFYEDIIKGE